MNRFSHYKLGALIAGIATGSMSSLQAAPVDIITGVQTATTAGVAIQAHGGGILKAGNYFYWYGQDGSLTFNAITCYRSPDLKNWTYQGDALTTSSLPASLLPCRIQRPHVVYNSTAKTYVMYMHFEAGTSGFVTSDYAVAYASTPDGNFTWLANTQSTPNPTRPLACCVTDPDDNKPGFQSRDCTVFEDTDGSAYFISAANGNRDTHVYKLSSDYLTIDTAWNGGQGYALLWKGQYQEGYAMFKRSGVYFIASSGTQGWTPNQQAYGYSTSIASGWSNLIYFGNSNCYDAQTSAVVPISGTTDTEYLWMGDRNAPYWGGDFSTSQYLWLKLGFASSTAMSMDLANVVTVDTAAGTISQGTYNFKFINVNSGKVLEVPSFSTIQGKQLDQWTDNGGLTQEWARHYDSAGAYTMVNANSGYDMEVKSGSQSPGAVVDQWQDNGGLNQQWTWEDHGNDIYTFVNVNSGMNADVSGGSLSNGGPIVQSASNGNASQQWQAVPLK